MTLKGKKEISSLGFLYFLICSQAFGEPIFIFNMQYDTEHTKVFKAGDEMTYWPAELFCLVNLEELIINSRNVCDIPDGMENFTKLRIFIFYVRGHEICGISSSLGALTSLNELHLNLRNLLLLPDEFSNLTSLETLNLAGQNTKEIFSCNDNDEITHLKKLLILREENRTKKSKERRLGQPYLPQLRWFYINSASKSISQFLLPKKVVRS